MKYLPLLFACVTPFAACGKSDPATPPPAGGAGAATPKADDDHGHGVAREIGTCKVGAHSFDLVVHVKDNKPTAVDVAFPQGATVPGTVRVWVGVESGQGSLKEKLGKDGDKAGALHGHLEAPATLPDGSKLWIEIEENGKTERAGFAWK